MSSQQQRKKYFVADLVQSCSQLFLANDAPAFRVGQREDRGNPHVRLSAKVENQNPQTPLSFDDRIPLSTVVLTMNVDDLRTNLQ